MSEFADRLKALLDELEEGAGLDAVEYVRTPEIVPDPRPNVANARAGIEGLFHELRVLVGDIKCHLEMTEPHVWTCAHLHWERPMPCDCGEESVRASLMKRLEELLNPTPSAGC